MDILYMDRREISPSGFLRRPKFDLTDQPDAIVRKADTGRKKFAFFRGFRKSWGCYVWAIVLKLETKVRGIKRHLLGKFHDIWVIPSWSIIPKNGQKWLKNVKSGVSLTGHIPGTTKATGNLISYLKSCWTFLSKRLLLIFRYLQSFTHKNDVKVDQFPFSWKLGRLWRKYVSR